MIKLLKIVVFPFYSLGVVYFLLSEFAWNEHHRELRLRELMQFSVMNTEVPVW